MRYLVLDAHTRNLLLFSSLAVLTPSALGGCAGERGEPGPAGVDGTNGTDGVDGTNGTDGTNGSDGEDGRDGESLSAATEPPGENCEFGGIALSDAEGVVGYLCNGEDGTSGDDGSALTAVVEPAGGNCSNGGFEIFQDGVSLGFLCNGEDGSDAAANPDVYVDGNDPSCADGLPGTQEVPNCTIQGALSHVGHGRSVFVAQGTYQAFHLATSAEIYGGYDASDWSRDIVNNVTSVEQASPRGIPTIDTEVYTTAVLDGLRITGPVGVAASTVAIEANGLLTINNCWVNGGFACADGNSTTACSSTAVVTSAGALVSIQGSYLHGGSTAGTSTHLFAGPRALANGASDTTVVNSILHGGTATGGSDTIALYSARGTARVVNSTLYGGISDLGSSWGVRYNSFGSIDAVNNYIDGGQAPLGTVTAVDASSSTSLASTFTNNNLFNVGGGRLSHDGQGDITDIAVINNCVNGGSGGAEWNWGCVDAETGGNVSVDPGWSSVSWFDGAAFSLPGTPGAGMIDAGVDPSTSPAALVVTIDYAGSARPVGGYDIGHVEVQP